MPMRALYQLAQRLRGDPSYLMAPPGRSYQKVSFVVVIERDGSLVGIEDFREADGGKAHPRPVLVLGITKPSGSGINPCFLWDSTEYLLGWSVDPGKLDRARERTFPAFREKHLGVEKEIDDPAFSAVCRFLEGWDPGKAADHPVLEEIGGGFGLFRLRGETSFVHDREAVRQWWDRRTGQDPDRMQKWWTTGSDEEPPVGECLVTGQRGPIARLHPKVKGVVGAHTAGATIAGFNNRSFESYGLTQSFNAPVSVEAAHLSIGALNALLSGPGRERHCVIVGGTTVVFWTERPSAVEDVFAQFLSRGSAALEEVEDPAQLARLQALVRAVREGKAPGGGLVDDPGGTGFFILGLAAPTPARIAVRFFHRGSVDILLGNLHRHFSDIRVAREYGKGRKKPQPEFPAAWYLLQETAAPGGEIPPLLAPAFLEAIVTGKRYPESLFTTVMRRITVDGTVNYPRACLVRGYLVRNLGKEVHVSLDTSRTDPGYRLGRLFAVLEKTQSDALGGQLNSTIRERYYGSASATPAAVFPRLLRTYQHHLAKLDPGWKIHREKLVQEILDPLGAFPAHLGLAEQGLFALGYYHQRNALFGGGGKEAEEAGD